MSDTESSELREQVGEEVIELGEGTISKSKFSKNTKTRSCAKKSTTPLPDHIINQSTSAAAGPSAKSVNRRKSNHKVINVDDEMVFESLSLNSSKKGKSVRKNTKTNIPKEKDEVKSSESALDESIEENPALEYMHRVAFLRACVNYMLISVGKDTIDFQENEVTLSRLVNKYNQISPPEDDEVIGLSD